jgi:hypothetical protein
MCKAGLENKHEEMMELWGEQGDLLPATPAIDKYLPAL